MGFLASAVGFWVGQAKDFVGSVNGHATNGWSSGQLWSTTASTWQTNSNAAYDSGSWGSGNLWSTDAHGDPNVFTNQFNAGAASKTTSVQTSTTWTSQTNVSTEYQAMSFTAFRTGLAQISAYAQMGNPGTNATGHLTCKVNGTVVATGPNSSPGGGGSNSTCAVVASVSVNNGDTITIWAGGNGFAHFNNGGTLYVTIGNV
ncbi:MAG: hypothetical protein J2P17_14600 [Mycobacterium sp.]|nr:hypothetical protein [Mycobacterium sp.]